MATTNTEDNLIVKEEASENVEVVDDSSPTTTKTEATNDQPNDEPTTPVVQRQRTNSSTSSTSDKQQQQQENNKKQLSKHISEMFENVTQVIQGEMKAGFNELLLLQTMNETVAKRYEGMVDRSQIIQQQIVEVREQYEKLVPYFEQIDEIDANITELNKVVNWLDTHTRQLELQLKPFL